MRRLFFDVDGVLINGFHAREERRNRWDKNIEADLGIRFENFQEIFGQWFPEVLQGRLDFEEEMDRWLKRNDYDLKAWQVINYWHQKDSDVESSVIEVVCKLSVLPDLKLYTATNQTHARIIYLRDVLRWGYYFSDFYYSARLGCLKNNPEYFIKIENHLGSSPESEIFLYFDDDPVNIQIAAARGWNAVLVNDPDDVVMHPLIREWLL